MKLHRINNQGTLAVVIPKDIAQMLGWKEGHDIIVATTNDDTCIHLVNRALRNNQ